MVGSGGSDFRVIFLLELNGVAGGRWNSERLSGFGLFLVEVVFEADEAPHWFYPPVFEPSLVLTILLGIVWRICSGGLGVFEMNLCGGLGSLVALGSRDIDRFDLLRVHLRRIQFWSEGHRRVVRRGNHTDLLKRASLRWLQVLTLTDPVPFFFFSDGDEVVLFPILDPPNHVHFFTFAGLQVEQQLHSSPQFPVPKLCQPPPDILNVHLSFFGVDCVCELQALQLQTYDSHAEQVRQKFVERDYFGRLGSRYFFRGGVALHELGEVVGVFGVRCGTQPRVFEVDAFGVGIDGETVQAQLVILPLEALAILPQPAEVGLDDLSDFFLPKRFLIKPPLNGLILQRITILTSEHQKVVFFVGADSPLVQQVVGFQLGDGFAASSVVLGDDFLDAVAVGGRVGGDFVEGAELVGGAMQEVGVGLYLVFALEGFGELLVGLTCQVAHLIIQILFMSLILILALTRQADHHFFLPPFLPLSSFLTANTSSLPTVLSSSTVLRGKPSWVSASTSSSSPGTTVHRQQIPLSERNSLASCSSLVLMNFLSPVLSTSQMYTSSFSTFTLSSESEQGYILALLSEPLFSTSSRCI